MLNFHPLKTLFFIAVTIVTIHSPFSTALAMSPSDKLVKCAENADVYYVDTEYTTTLRLIANEVVFLANGFSWSDIVIISCEQIQEYPLSFYSFPNGKLLKFADSPEVYERRLYCNTRSGGCTDFYYHIPNEMTAVSVIGDNWQQKIIEFPSHFKNLLSLRGYVSGMNVPYSDDAWYFL